MSEGRFRRAYLGIAGGSRPLPPREASRLGRRFGIEVVEVAPNSPAAARLHAEDLIVAVDETPVEDVSDLQRLMVSDAIDARLALTLLREGRELTVEVVPVELEL
jgi:S1-C subfamily serine protease